MPMQTGVNRTHSKKRPRVAFSSDAYWRNYNKVYLALCDGFCSNNGQPDAVAGVSYVAFDVTDWSGMPVPSRDAMQRLNNDATPVIRQVRKYFSQIAAPARADMCPTNNLAEATALAQLITEAYHAGVIHPDNFVHIWTDSQLIVRQVLGLSKVNNKQLEKQYQYLDSIGLRYKIEHDRSLWDNLVIKHITGKLMKYGPIDH